MKYLFYKEEGRWYIHLKYNIFPHRLLEMVAGADDILESLAQGKDKLILKIDTHVIPYYDGKLELERKLGIFKGAWYNNRASFIPKEGFKITDIWLCPVTLWVFLKYPERIYYKVVEK